MRKTILSLAVLLFSFGAVEAVAQCPTVHGPHYSGPFAWYYYEAGAGCYTLNNSVTTATVGCYGGAGFQFGGGFSNSAAYSFVVGSQVLNPAKWTADSWIEFQDPNNDWWNQVRVDVDVYTPGVGTTTTNIFYWNGTMGDLNGCTNQWAYFSANTGDTVTVRISGASWYSNTTIRASVPRVFSQNM